MGSSGSGRWGNHRKAITVERCRVIELAAVARGEPTGSLCWFRDGVETATIGYALVPVGSDRRALRLSYQLLAVKGGEKPCRFVYDVALERAQLPRRGFRWWGRCPLAVGGRGCGRRVGKLYLPPGADHFGCRRCFRLTYASRQEHDGRVTALLNDPDTLREIGTSPTGVGVTVLGLALKAVTSEQSRAENRLKRNALNVGAVRSARRTAE